MQRQRGTVPIGDALSGMDCPVDGDPQSLAPGDAPLHPLRSKWTSLSAPKKLTYPHNRVHSLC